MGLLLGFCTLLLTTSVTNAARSLSEQHSLHVSAMPAGFLLPRHGADRSYSSAVSVANVPASFSWTHLQGLFHQGPLVSVAVAVKQLRLRGEAYDGSVKVAGGLRGSRSWQVVFWAVILPLVVLMAVLLFSLHHLKQDPSVHHEGNVAKCPVSKVPPLEKASPPLDKGGGTPCRMARLPPTARPGSDAHSAMIPQVPAEALGKPATLIGSRTSFGLRPLQPPQSPLGVASTALSSGIGPLSSLDSVDSEARSLPPPLSPAFSAKSSMLGSQVSDSAASESSAFTWTVTYQACHAFGTGSASIEVAGTPPFHVTLARGPEHESWLEVSRTPSCDLPEAIIGPLNVPSEAAKIQGPSGQEYGSFVRDGDGFAVTHVSHDSCVLMLKPVHTKKGSFLEVSAPDGQPIGLANLNLNQPGEVGVEINADPEVDPALIVSCVLASFVADPSLIAECQHQLTAT